MSWYQNVSISSERTLAWQGLLLVFGLAWACAMTASAEPAAAPVRQPRLRVAAAEFGVLAEANASTSSRVGARATEVVGPLKTTILLLEDADTRLCVVTTHFGPTIPANVSKLFRESLARKLGLAASHVWIFTSHNHSGVTFAGNPVPIHALLGKRTPPAVDIPGRS